MNDLDPRLSRVCDDYKHTVYNKDIDAFLDLYHPAARVFDTWGVWSYEGVKARREVVADWFSSLGDERVSVKFDRVQVTITSDLASLTARVVYAAILPQAPNCAACRTG